MSLDSFDIQIAGSNSFLNEDRLFGRSWGTNFGTAWIYGFYFVYGITLSRQIARDCSDKTKRLQWQKNVTVKFRSLKYAHQLFPADWNKRQEQSPQL
jgi:hypothetical protein